MKHWNRKATLRFSLLEVYNCWEKKIKTRLIWDFIFRLKFFVFHFLISFSLAESLCIVVANVLDCNVIVSEFKFQ